MSSVTDPRRGGPTEPAMRRVTDRDPSAPARPARWPGARVGILLGALAGFHGIDLGVDDATAATADGRGTVRIVATASVRGELGECGCESGPQGGVARRHLFLDGLRDDGEILLLDAGDFASDDHGPGLIQSDSLWAYMTREGYDAVALGEHELALPRALGEGDGPARLAANLRLRDGDRPVGESIRIFTVDGIPVGVTAVIAPTVLDSVAAASARFVSDDPVPAARDALARMRADGARVAILLAHMGYDAARALVREVPGFDVVVVGHAPGVRTTHGIERGTVLVRPGDRGRYVAEVVLRLDPHGVAEVAGRVHGLDPDLPASVELGRWVARIGDQVDAARRAALRAARSQTAADGPRLTGATACAECHAEIHAGWADTPHAHAYETLVDAGMGSEPECVGCHVTGDAATAMARPELRGVQCEVCHLVPTHHPEPPEVPAVEPVRCRRCHDPANSPDFDPPTYWEKILHGVDGR